MEIASLPTPEQLRAHLASLEKRAGISEEVERAWEGPLFPLGAFGDEASPEQYFDDQHDFTRRKIRDLYFGVKDPEIRKELISFNRNLARIGGEMSLSEVKAAESVLAQAKARTEQLPWGQAAFIGAGSVALGYFLAGIAGAIGGAVFGFFVGQGTIGNARARASRELLQAENDLKSYQEVRQGLELRPDFFTDREALTGDRDKAFDYESAVVNRAQQVRRQGTNHHA